MIVVGDLKWVAEIFFPWGDKPCHQICLYYDVALKSEMQIPLDDMFVGDEHIEVRDFKIEFHWMPIGTLSQPELYPTNVADLMKRYNMGFQHFVYREEVRC